MLDVGLLAGAAAATATATRNTTTVLTIIMVASGGRDRSLLSLPKAATHNENGLEANIWKFVENSKPSVSFS